MLANRMLMASSGRAVYRPQGAYFDGTNDYMTRASAFTGAADGDKFIASFWANLQGGNGAALSVYYPEANDTVYIQRNSSNKWYCRLAGAAVDITSSNSYSTSANTGWNHVLIARNGTTIQMYINDASDVGASNTAAANADFTQGGENIGANRLTNERFNGYLADLYINTAEYLDISDEANRRLFINAAGKAVDLGADGSTPTGTAPAFYGSIAADGAVTDFATNLAGKGDMSISGTLVAVSGPNG